MINIKQYPLTTLKIALMCQGVYVKKEAKNYMRQNSFGQFNFDDYSTTGGLILSINKTTYVNVPVRFFGTPFVIDNEKGNFILYDTDNLYPKVSIEILPTPRYALENTLLDKCVPVRDLVMTHADRARLSPIHGCNFACHFCSLSKNDYKKNDIALLERTLEIALVDPYIRPKHVLISGGTPRATEEDFRYIDEVYSYFPKKYPNLEFDVMLSPRSIAPKVHSRVGYKEFLYFLKNSGVTSLAVNMELFGYEISKKYMEDKHEIGRPNYLLFIEEAVKIFGDEKVRSCLIIGLEEQSDTLKAIDTLCSIGCMPVLSPFIPDARSFLSRHKPPTADELFDTLIKSQAIADSYNIRLGPVCRSCSHNCILIED